jgi:hypothetical protein
MAESDKTIILPEGTPNYGGWGSGFGSFNSIADLFGLAIIASMFGWGNGFGGFGGGWGGGNSGAGFLSNQLNNDSGRELIMNAINAQGEASRSAVQNLATALGQDFNLVNAGVQNVQNALSALALQQAVSVPQIMNAIASGDASIISAFQQCCCENKLLVTTQGYENQLRTVAQTNEINGNIADLKATVIDQFCGLEKREMQSKIAAQAETISQLRGQIDNANQTAAITGYVNSLVTPLAAKVDQIASKQLPTVNVQWPQLQAINTTPYVSGGIYGAYGYGYGNNGLVF